MSRRADRLGSAALRAVGQQPGAEIRGTRLEVDDRVHGVAVPYLWLDLDDVPMARRRGVIDGHAVRLRYSDRSLHLELSPDDSLERLIFEIAEQFRCEAIIPEELRGVRSNISVAFDAWDLGARGSGISDTGVGLLVYTVTHMLRARLLKKPADEAVDDIIETPRGNLARLVGHALAELPALVDDQAAYAVPALEIARLVGEMANDAGEDGDASESDRERHRLLIPVDWDAVNEEKAEAEGADALPAPDSDYRVFTAQFDIELRGDQLYRDFALRTLRADLDEHAKAQTVSVTRLAQRMGRLFEATRFDGWTIAEEDGDLDPTRLARVIIDPADEQIHRLPRPQPTTNALVTFLLDTTGSMKVQRYETMAVLVDTLVRALDMAGVATEVLGFTTSTWAGGESAKAWKAAGEPANPGRLCDLQHIVYKSADQSWRHARFSLAAMLRVDHYREGVDGEALEWAHRRSLSWNPVGDGADDTGAGPRRAIVAISDGAPMETSTSATNRDGLLHEHLRHTADSIMRSSPVELGAIGVDLDVSPFYVNAVDVDLTGTLTISSYDALARLFG